MFLRLFKYSFKNILRNTFLSFSSILVLTLLMFFINILLVIHDVSFRIIDNINDKLTISLYLNEEYNKNSWDIIDLLGNIKQTFPNIRTAYKTKEEVLEDIRDQDPELVKILERQNPLPETISLTNIHLNQFEQLNYIIEGKAYVLSESEEWEKEHFSNYSAQYSRITKVISTLWILQVGLYIIIWIFLFSIAIIIYSIIWNFIYYYRNEIYITRLVGGSKFFIYGPFSLQGAIYSVIAFLVSSALFLFLLKSIEIIFNMSFSEGGFLSQLPMVLFIELLVCIGIWGLSGLLSSRKYLK